MPLLSPSPPLLSHNHAITSHYSSRISHLPLLISITWCRSLMGQGFCVAFQLPSSPTQQQCKVDMKPWLFWKKQGSKRMDMAIGDKSEGKRACVEIAWNLASARYAGGPEPCGCFYLMITCEREVVLLLGDMQEEALKKTNKEMAMVEEQRDRGSAMVSRKEYVYGRQVYETKAQVCKGGRQQSISIEYREEEGGRLCVKVDNKVVVDIKGGSLMWKFRGNKSVDIDGHLVDVYWDVHDWLFLRPHSGHAAVFMFLTSNQKPDNLLHPSSYPPDSLLAPPSPFTDDPHHHHHDFSLLLFAVKNNKIASS